MRPISYAAQSVEDFFAFVHIVPVYSTIPPIGISALVHVAEWWAQALIASIMAFTSSEVPMSKSD